MTRPIFGVAGYPPAFWDSLLAASRLDAPEWLASLQLDLLELQMTYGPRMKPDTAKALHENALRFGVTLTIHASYFIVLTSSDETVVDRSIATLEKTCQLAALCGAQRIVLHPGSAYSCRDDALDRFIANCRRFVSNYMPDGIALYPETAGKRGQVGSLEDILHICSEVPRCLPCLDFGHLRAFNLGGYDTAKAVLETILTVRERLGASAVENLHAHIAPIEFGGRGEIRHRAYDESEGARPQASLFESSTCLAPYLPRPEILAEAAYAAGAPLWIVSECHDSQEKGAIAMRNRFRQLQFERDAGQCGQS